MINRKARKALVTVLGGFVMMGGSASVFAQSLDWGGSLRGYQFSRVEGLPDALQVARWDSEFLSSRFTFDAEFVPQLTMEVHLVMDFLSPPDSNAASVATGKGAFFLPLQHDFLNNEDIRLVGGFDRVNLNLDFGSWSIVAGRQAIGWGVSHFWPAMDLFSSFAPERIDRDYKQGVDAVRVTVPLGDYSEVQVIGAILGPSLDRDGSLAAQTRLNLGPVDLGLMGGKFHGDTVAGVFLTSGIGRSAVRTEVTWTDSGDPLDGQFGRGQFWRGSVGVDRQLNPEVGVTVELSYNGYGTSDASQYILLAQSDRVQRGEMNALGKYYVGSAVVWQISPLWTMSQTLLFNWNDPSAYWIPGVEWSTSDNSSLLLAVQTGFGGAIQEDLTIESEYGSVPTTVFAAFKWYF